MQMSKPKISICIPTYNREKYLDWQLNQFLNFKDKINDWEFVISSNGSADNTKSVVEKYQNKLRIIFYEFPENLDKNFPCKNYLHDFRMTFIKQIIFG